jgi:hypothetical protein
MLFQAWAWLKTKLVLFGVLAAGVLALFWSIKRSGRQDEKIETLERTLINVLKKEEVAREVERLPVGDAARRLHDNWRRD